MIRIKNRLKCLYPNSFVWLQVNSFEWVEDSSEFDEGFIKSYNEKSKEGYFLG